MLAEPAVVNAVFPTSLPTAIVFGMLKVPQNESFDVDPLVDVISLLLALATLVS